MKTKTYCLEEAKKSAVKTPQPRKETRSTEESLARLQEIKSTLLPIEGDARTALNMRMIDLENNLANTRKENEREDRIAALPYPVLDPVVFSWRKKGFPVLAPFKLDNPDCIISTDSDFNVLPSCCWGLYGDVRQRIETFFAPGDRTIISVFVGLTFLTYKWFCGFSVFKGVDPSFTRIFCGASSFLVSLITQNILRSITGGYFGLVPERSARSRTVTMITARFQGIIPATTRQKIREAKESKKFQEIFILAEVPKWKISTKIVPAPIRDGDPFVIGWDGEFFRLIDAFDTTSVERYIADEFTVSSQKV